MARYFRRGVTQVWFNALGSSSVTRFIRRGLAEVIWYRGGLPVSLTSHIANISGFTVTSTPISVPNLTSNFASMIPGPLEVNGGEIEMYAIQGEQILRDPPGTNGHLLIYPRGLAGPCESWPLRLVQILRNYTFANETAKLRYTFMPTGNPSIPPAPPPPMVGPVHQVKPWIQEVLFSEDMGGGYVLDGKGQIWPFGNPAAAAPLPPYFPPPRRQVRPWIQDRLFATLTM